MWQSSAFKALHNIPAPVKCIRWLCVYKYSNVIFYGNADDIIPSAHHIFWLQLMHVGLDNIVWIFPQKYHSLWIIINDLQKAKVI